jgi:hypothetical protein
MDYPEDLAANVDMVINDAQHTSIRLNTRLSTASMSANDSPLAAAHNMMQEELEHPKSFICPISLDLMRDPVMLGTTGHTYEREVIKKCLRGRRRNPLTNEDLRRDECFLTPNRTLKQAIAEYCQRRNIPWEILTTDNTESDEDVFDEEDEEADRHPFPTYAYVHVDPTGEARAWVNEMPARQPLSYYFSRGARHIIDWNPGPSVFQHVADRAPRIPPVEEAELLSEEGLDPRDITLVIEQANCTRNAAIRALRNHNSDLVEAIMEVMI